MNLKDRIQIIERNKIMDSKGWFLKVITGKEDNLPTFTGEVYLICGSIGETRANHYHIEANEWFTVIQGKVLMKIEDINSKEKLEFILDSDGPKTVYVPNMIAHSFENIGNDEYVLIAYADKFYDPQDTLDYIL